MVYTGYMFVQVKLLKGFQKKLLYKIPDSWENKNIVGKIVKVPIRTQFAAAIVLQQFSKITEKSSFNIREIQSIEPFPDDENYEIFTKKMGQYYQIDHLHFLKRIRNFLLQKQKRKESSSRLIENKKENNKKVVLTPEQQTVVSFLSEKIKKQVYQPTVLHGVTGSGKTEVYKKLIIKTIENKKSAILLLPEITLAIQFNKLMKQQLPCNIAICSFHSGISVKNKKIAWRLLIEQKPILLIGVHVPILLPIADLGLIIVDEEHESGYQEKKHPKINSKDAAIIRAHINKIPIILGSATPSLSSLYNVKSNNWKFFQLKKRFSGNFPEIKTVFLDTKKKRKSFWISQELENSLRIRLLRKEQSIIFLNRRGFSFFVQCKNCSFIFECPNCSVSLTLHQQNVLTCHYCEHNLIQPELCPSCKTKTFIKKGIGTQQVVTILQKIFPQASIGRADLDATTKKTVWQKTIQEFEARKIDILVGTQTITKGFHFPHVTLVGILWADLNLHFPIYNATENTLQQLIQVAGRAGRQQEKSEVIVQAMTEHGIFRYLNETDYLKFYGNEIKKREFLGYPPYKRLAEIELKHTNEVILTKEATNLTTTFLRDVKRNKHDIQVLGPAIPPISKIKNIYIRKIYLKGNNIKHIGMLFDEIDRENYHSKIFFTPNPLN